jgi:hypothetical protein
MDVEPSSKPPGCGKLDFRTEQIGTAKYPLQSMGKRTLISSKKRTTATGSLELDVALAGLMTLIVKPGRIRHVDASIVSTYSLQHQGE